MKFIAAIVLSGALLASSANAACIVTPFEQDLAEADFVFLATVTSATLEESVGTLRDGNRPKVKHSYEVRRTFKGDAAKITGLYSFAGYDDPTDDRFILGFAELVPIYPGQSLLVVGRNGSDAYVSLCSASRRWDAETAAAVRSHFAP